MNFFSYLCTKLKFHMPKRTPEIEQLLVDVEEKFGTKPHSPADFNELIIAIKKETNASIGLSTLERLWGYVNNVDKPQISSLNKLALYLDYKNWNEYLQYIREREQSNASHILEGAIRASDLGIGRLVGVKIGFISYVFRYLGKMQFEVVMAKHSSILVPGATFTTTFFMKGRPLYLDNLRIEGKEPIVYAAGGGAGLRDVWLVNGDLNLPLDNE
jgi:hypothetical protein